MKLDSQISNPISAYASLPKLQATPGSGPYDTGSRSGMNTPLSKSTEDLLKSVNLPPRPDEMTEEMEIAALEKQFQKAELDMETESFNSVDSESSRSSGSATPSGSVSSASTQTSYVNAKLCIYTGGYPTTA